MSHRWQRLATNSAKDGRRRREYHSATLITTIFPRIYARSAGVRARCVFLTGGHSPGYAPGRRRFEKTHLLAAQRSSFKDQIHATFGAEAYERAIFDKWGESWLAMQNDKELSFRIYSAGAAQKPNRLELEDGELVGLFNLLLGILLGAFDTLAGEEGESGKTERSLVAGELGSGGGDGAHFISNCFFTEPRNAVLLKAKRPARSTFISAMPFVDSIHGCPSHAWQRQRPPAHLSSKRATQVLSVTTQGGKNGVCRGPWRG